MTPEQLARLPGVLFEIGKVVGSDQEPGQTLARISELICELTGADACSVMLLDGKRQRLLAKASYGLRTERIHRLSFAIGEGVAGWVLQRGEVVSSVVCGHRSALTRRGFAVDDDFLALACQEAAAEVAMAQRPSLAAVSPGVHCRYCDLRPECPEGSARVESVVRLPFPSRSPRCR